MGQQSSVSEKLENLEEHHLKYHHKFETRRIVILAILTIIVSMLLISYVF